MRERDYEGGESQQPDRGVGRGAVQAGFKNGEDEGSGDRDRDLLYVVPHVSLSHSHRPLNQSVNEKLISSAPTLLPPHTSLLANSNCKNHHLRSIRLSLHLRHLYEHPCPHHLARRRHNEDVGTGKVSVLVQGDGDANSNGDLPTSVDLVEGIPKAFRRRAEALEGLEKWETARCTWEVLFGAEWGGAGVKGRQSKL